MHEWSKWGLDLFVHVFPGMTQTSCLTTAFYKTLVVVYLVCCFVSSLVACLFCMPPKKGLCLLEATKAYQVEQKKTENREKASSAKTKTKSA